MPDCLEEPEADSCHDIDHGSRIHQPRADNPQPEMGCPDVRRRRIAAADTVARLYGQPTDSQNARLAVLNPLQKARTRHIDIRYKWINQAVAKGDIMLEFVGTVAMKADGLMEPLERGIFVRQHGLASVIGCSCNA